MTTVATLDCPLCALTVLGQGASTVEAASAAIDAFEDHLTEHHKNSTEGAQD